MAVRKSGFGDNMPKMAAVVAADQYDALVRNETSAVLVAELCFWMNGEAIHPLSPGWMSAVDATSPAPLTPSQKERLSAAVETYYLKRLAIITATTARELKTHLGRIEASGLRFLEAIEIDGQASVNAWKAMESVEPGTLKRDAVYPAITMLINRAHRAQSLSEDVLKGMPKSPDPDETWLTFVSELMDFYRVLGGNVTITKRGSLSGASAFSRFVWQILQSLPQNVRQHSADDMTLSEALNDARRRLRLRRR